MAKRGGFRQNAGRTPKDKSEVKIGTNVYFTRSIINKIKDNGRGDSFSCKVNELVVSELNNRKRHNTVKYVDLFAGMGGMRLALEQALKAFNLKGKCVLTSEIKEFAKKALIENFKIDHDIIDINNIDIRDIEDFDILLAGFPCQAFSSAGKGHGFADTRGTLFFEVEKILKQKKPNAFLLENVEGLVTHDRQNKNDPIGRTLSIILKSLKNIGYKVTYSVLDSKDFGLPQSRKRIYITGSLKKEVVLGGFTQSKAIFKDIMEQNLTPLKSDFTAKLLKHYTLKELHGKAVKDKRGGENNIHSWDLELKGKISKKQKLLLTNILLKRRQKKWAEETGIDWMDGMPLTYKQIKSFFDDIKLQKMLSDLVDKGYLKLEYPKKRQLLNNSNGTIKVERVYDVTKEKGYNIVSGKLSFEFTKFINSNEITPTVVAMDAMKLGVIDKKGIRNLSIREGLRLFGYPDNYSLDFLAKQPNKAFDLLGNTVAVPVVTQVAEKIIDAIQSTI